MRDIFDARISRVLTFKAGGGDWALSLGDLREIVHLSHLTAPPVISEFLEGFLNLGGEQVPVIRLSILLGLPSTLDGLYTPILLLKRGTLGLLIDEVGEIIDVPPQSLRAAPSGQVLNDFIEAEFPYRDGSVHLIDSDKVLLQEEKLRLRDLHDQHRRRLARLESNS